jgi:predicted ArsR family transcriptional regulator
MFNGVKRAYILQIAYIMKVIEKYGTDEALGILEEAAQRQGTITAREMRRTLPKDLSPLDTAVEVYRRFMSDTGAEVTEHQRDENSVTFLINRCPFYEAFLDIGVDCGMFLNGLCNNLTLPSIQCTLTHFDSRLKIEPVVSRESAEEICMERVYLSE